MPLKIAIIDDKANNRNIIQDKLMKNGMFKINVVAENGKDFLDKMKSLKETDFPDVALMDLEMPEMDGVSAIAAGSSFYPSVKFVVLTIFDDEEKIFNAIKAGAYGYLLKEETAEKISEILWQMHENNVGPLSPGIAYKILQMVQRNELNMPGQKESKSVNSFFDLTDREKQILQLLVKGYQYKEIGNSLNISVNTAKKHVINIYEKLHVNSRAQALRLAYEKGLL